MSFSSLLHIFLNSYKKPSTPPLFVLRSFKHISSCFSSVIRFQSYLSKLLLDSIRSFPHFLFQTTYPLLFLYYLFSFYPICSTYHQTINSSSTLPEPFNISLLMILRIILSFSFLRVSY